MRSVDLSTVARVQVWSGRSLEPVEAGRIEPARAASWNNPAVALLRRKRDDSASSQPPDDLAMTIEDVFWIAPPPDAKLDPIKRRIAGRAPGAVLLRELTGSGTLKPGDFVINEGGRSEIEAIEAFRELLDRVEPPRNIGLRFGTAVDRAVFAKGSRSASSANRPPGSAASW